MLASNRRVTATSILLVVLLATPTVAAAVEEAAKQLTVIGLADLHGALEPSKRKTKAGQEIEVGGAAWIAAYVKGLRALSEGAVVLLDAGDLFHGTLISNSAEGEPVVRLHNYLDVDAVAVGNHEFDFGPVGRHSVPKSPQDDPRGALKQRIQEAHFPFLAANMRTTSGNHPQWSKPAVLIDRAGVRIGIVGAAYEQTPATTTKRNLHGLEFLPAAPALLREAKKLRQQGADFVLLTAHIGGGCEDNRAEVVDDLNSCSVHDIIKLLDEMPPGTFDLVLAGHTHQPMNKLYHQTVVLQPAAHGHFVAWAHLQKRQDQVVREQKLIGVCSAGVFIADQLHCDREQLDNHVGKLRPAMLLGKPLQADPQVKKMFAADTARTEKILSKPLGAVTTARFERGYYGESAMGNFAVDMLAAAMRRLGERFDVALTNNGGVRADLPSGPLRFGHIYKASPFDNSLALITVDGKTLKRMAQWGIARKRGGLSWSGLTFTATGCEIGSIAVKGKPLQADATYRIATHSYLAGGGGGFDRFNLTAAQVRILEEELPLRELIASELELSKPTLRPQDFYDPNKPRLLIQKICKG